MLIVDTGPIVAAADRNDRNHAQYSEVLGDFRGGPLVTTAMAIAEAAYLIEKKLPRRDR